MRIVSGRWAGTDLVSPAGRVRPTSELLRAACMKLIEGDLGGARVLDLFAGSGALGLEALSRGARSCDFVENNPAALHALKANVARLRLKDETRVFKRDAIPFVEQLKSGTYDIAFADPPYGSKKLDRVHQRWRTAPFSLLLVLEYEAHHPIALAGRSVRIEDSVVTVLTVPSG